MWQTQLIWISHMTNTTDMDFARDEYDWYGKISSVLLPTHSHMFVLEVKVQYTIIIIYQNLIHNNHRVLPGAALPRQSSHTNLHHGPTQQCSRPHPSPREGESLHLQLIMTTMRHRFGTSVTRRLRRIPPPRGHRTSTRRQLTKKRYMSNKFATFQELKQPVIKNYHPY